MLVPASALADIAVTVEPPFRALVMFERGKPPSHMPVVAGEGSADCRNTV